MSMRDSFNVLKSEIVNGVEVYMTQTTVWPYKYDGKETNYYYVGVEGRVGSSKSFTRKRDARKAFTELKRQVASDSCLVSCNRTDQVHDYVWHNLEFE